MGIPVTFNTAQLQDNLNRSMPAAKEAGLGDLVFGLVRAHNQLVALLAGAGIAGVNAATLPAAITLPGS